jgi:hypothetical protein
LAYVESEDLSATVKKRGDSKIISWKIYAKANVKDKVTGAKVNRNDKSSIFDDIVNQKSFMKGVGPGSYSL